MIQIFKNHRTDEQALERGWRGVIDKPLYQTHDTIYRNQRIYKYTYIWEADHNYLSEEEEERKKEKRIKCFAIAPLPLILLFFFRTFFVCTHCITNKGHFLWRF